VILLHTFCIRMTVYFKKGPKYRVTENEHYPLRIKSTAGGNRTRGLALTSHQPSYLAGILRVLKVGFC
jgi:hypothetical protein